MTELVVPVVFDDGVLTVDLEHLPAYGRRHPTGPGQLSVYEIAHRRLND